MSGQTRRHHVVSRGYQRNFAAGERLLLIDKTTKAARLVGTRDAFHADRFNSQRGPDGWDDTLEQQWAQVEALALPSVRRVDDGTGDYLDRNVAKMAVALHLARSLTYATIHSRVVAEVTVTEGKRMASDPRFLAAFRSEHDREPAEGEVARIVAEAMAVLDERRGVVVQRMAHTYNTVISRIAQLHVQLLTAPPGFGWVTGDTPVVLTDNPNLRRLHARGDMAIFEATHWWMPLGRHVGLTLHTNPAPADEQVTPMLCQHLNWGMWRNCERFLACHPEDEPSRLLGTTILPSRPRPEL